MSVKITIQDNPAHCRQNLGEATSSKQPCWACMGVEEVRAGCRDCGGTGAIREKSYPWELTISDAGFHTLWRGLGVEAGTELEGWVDGRTLLKAIANADESRIKAAVAGADGFDAYTAPPLSLGQVRRYVLDLQTIAKEAERRESPVVWS